jgi:hypothetical protein
MEPTLVRSVFDLQSHVNITHYLEFRQFSNPIHSQLRCSIRLILFLLILTRHNNNLDN